MNLTHSPIGPSSYKRVSLCPASMKLAQQIESLTSDEAKRGTDLHELASQWLQLGIGEVVYASEADMEAVLPYVSHCQGLMENADQYWIEQRFEIPHPSELFFGTVDFASVSDESITIPDYKSGREKVEAEGNTQLLYYGAAVLKSLAKEIADKIKIANLQIAQYGRIDNWTVPVSDLEVFSDELTATLEAAEAEDAPFNPGPVQCKYCPAVAICDAYKEDLEKRSGLKFENISGMKVPNVPALIEQRYLYVDEWQKYINAVKKQAEALIPKGYTFQYFKTEDKLGDRSWKDETFAAGLIQKAINEDGFEKKLKSPTQIMNIIDAAAKKVAKQATIPKAVEALLALREDVEAQIERKVTGKKLVKIGETHVTDTED